MRILLALLSSVVVHGNIPAATAVTPTMLRMRQGQHVSILRGGAIHGGPVVPKGDKWAWDDAHFDRNERYSTQDWWRQILSLPSSTILHRIAGHLVFNILLAIVVGYYHIVKGYNLALAGLPVSLPSFVLGLLLVFRTNSAYDRYWEARKILGDQINTVRNLAGMAKAFLPNQVAREMLELLEIFPITMAVHLQGGYCYNSKSTESHLAHTTEHLLSSPQGRRMHDKMDVVNCPPNYLLYYMRKMISGKTKNYQALRLTIPQEQALHAKISQLVDDLGKSERIKKTPVPLSYSHHTSRFVTVWCAALPFVLVQPLKWVMVPTVAILCWALMCVEEIGHCIENPFNLLDAEDRDNPEMTKKKHFVSLPLQDICRTIGAEAVDTLENYDDN